MTTSSATVSEVFPFGQPATPRPPSATQRREVYRLGAYPSGVHVRWEPPSVAGHRLSPVRALIVDNQPEPFWDGADADSRVAEWADAVGWMLEWGSARPAPPSNNGLSGKWVNEHILAPLGVGREQVCLSDCLDRARLNGNQARRIHDTYAPVADAVGLPTCTVRPVPAGESGIVREASEQHLPRMRAELTQCQPGLVVTLGNAAMRVMALLLEDAQPNPGRALSRDTYGRRVNATFQGRPLTWLPLVHPRTPPWPDIHTAWEQSRK